MTATMLAGGIFFITYALIVSEKIPRSIAAILGGVVMIILGVIPQEQAFHAVDWNVIFLLASMMVIANVLRDTGIFQWIALQTVRLGKGDPILVLILLSLITAVASAFLDNVTIVILIAPVTLFVATTLQVNPIPFLIAEILASNIGGMATLVGDPPNIMIGSAAGIDFLTFIGNMGPPAVIILAAFIGLAYLMFRSELKHGRANLEDIEALDASALITKPALMTKGLIVISAVIIGFLVHGIFHLEPASIALLGATLLMIWGKIHPHDTLRDVEWATLLFFIGLFISVEAIVEVGIIERIAQSALELTGGSLPITSMLLIWFSAIVSGIVDNIPYTATIIPLVENLSQTIPGQTLWWSLALGACLGGNFSLVGAAANVVVANIAEKSGHPIKFGQFLKYGVITTVMSLIIASFYVWIRYL